MSKTFTAHQATTGNPGWTELHGWSLAITVYKCPSVNIYRNYCDNTWIPVWIDKNEAENTSVFLKFQICLHEKWTIKATSERPGQLQNFIYFLVVWVANTLVRHLYMTVRITCDREKASCQNVSASVLPKSILNVQLIPFLCEMLQSELVLGVLWNRNERNMCWAKSSISNHSESEELNLSFHLLVHIIRAKSERE